MGAALLALAALATAGARWYGAWTSPSYAAPSPPPGPAARTAPSATASPTPSVTPSPSTPVPSASPTPTRPSSVPIPATGPGTFTVARASGAPVGHGARVLRYKVEVEDGLDVSARQAAAEVSEILGDPRGWTRDGVDSFQLVGSGPAGFVIKIATPGTVDDVCGRYGLDTGGEVNCRVGDDVMVNLKRWELGSPEFDGPLHDYRALIINHEVGHRIGHGHVTCPGPGRPAPAMMQQIKGLHGCVANAWPYDRDGRYLTGPSAP